VVLRSDGNNKQINGLIITANEWDGGDWKGRGIVYLDETNGAFTELIDTWIDRNLISDGYGTQATSTRFSYTGNFTSAAPVCFNLSTHLLFPQFRPVSVQATFAALERDASSPNWWVSQVGAPEGQDQRVVCVQVDVEGGSVYGRWFIDVDQSMTKGQEAVQFTAPSTRPTSAAGNSMRKPAPVVAS